MFPLRPAGAREGFVGFNVAGSCFFDDVVRQFRWLRTGAGVPPGFGGGEPIAHELFIERGLDFSGCVACGVPEAGGVGGQYFVGEDDGAVAVGGYAEFEFGVGDDDAAF